jgi:hypothetical protein
MGIKYSYDKTFFDTWNPQMAYILGFLYSDGSLIYSPNCRGYYIFFSSVDRDIIEKIKKTLQSEHTILIRNPPVNSNGKEFIGKKISYILRIGSKELYYQLLTFGLYQNKSLTIKFPDIPDIFVPHFIRGYFDGDGCVHIEKQKGRNSFRLRIIFTSGSFEFLYQLEKTICRICNLKQQKVHKGKRAFQLLYSTKDSTVLFDFMYKTVYDGLYLERKKKVFDSFIKA